MGLACSQVERYPKLRGKRHGVRGTGFEVRVKGYGDGKHKIIGFYAGYRQCNPLSPDSFEDLYHKPSAKGLTKKNQL